MSPLEIIGVISLGCLCWGAFLGFLLWTAREDRKLREEMESPFAAQLRRWDEAKDRTFRRQGITPLGKTRIGIDRR